MTVIDTASTSNTTRAESRTLTRTPAVAGNASTHTAPTITGRDPTGPPPARAISASM